MLKTRKIISYHIEKKLSGRAIAELLKISRKPVHKYIDRFNELKIDYEEFKKMTDIEISVLFNAESETVSDGRYEKLALEFDKMTTELKKTGVTLGLLWEEYINNNPDGYKYSQYCHHYQVWRDDTEKISMHIDRKAGDKMYVDFTGKKMKIVDQITGEIIEVEIFVAVLGGSGYTYVIAVENQKKESFIKATEKALRYFGGSPKAIVPDCLKSGVTKGCKYDPDINPEYSDFAEHYGTVVLPARPHCPKDKGLVENAVRIAYTRIFARLRNETFYTIEELNAAILEKLDIHNMMMLQREKISRYELFNKIEKGELSELPVEEYQRKNFSKSTVQINYHIYLSADRHYYSVPHRYKGKKVNVIYTENNVEIFFDNERIAFHKRNKQPGKYSTTPEHMPPKHRYIYEWNSERFLNWAEKIGNEVRQVVDEILKSKPHPEQAYKVCMGILSFSKKYGDTELNAACSRAVNFRIFSYKAIKNILEKGLYKITEELSLFQSLPMHDNIRGKQYYDTEMIDYDKFGNN